MIWCTNYGKLAIQTMFTLFFGGNTFAPKAPLYQGKTPQDLFQDCYVNCFAHLARYVQWWQCAVWGTDLSFWTVTTSYINSSNS